MYRTKVRISFHDTDPGGILFFANLLKHAHNVYEEFLESLELKRNFFFDEEYILPIVHTEADFMRPVRAGDTLNVGLKVINLKENSFELSYRFFGPDEELKAEAKTVHVAVNKRSFTKTSLPDELTRHLEANRN